jgi:hypothetical protein
MPRRAMAGGAAPAASRSGIGRSLLVFSHSNRSTQATRLERGSVLTINQIYSTATRK